MTNYNIGGKRYLPTKDQALLSFLFLERIFQQMQENIQKCYSKVPFNWHQHEGSECPNWTAHRRAIHSYKKP